MGKKTLQESNRKGQHTEQIIKKLGKADRRLTARQSVAQVCQALEMSEATNDGGRNQYGGIKAQETRWLKELAQENSRMKKQPIEAGLDKAMA